MEADDSQDGVGKLLGWKVGAIGWVWLDLNGVRRSHGWMVVMD